MRPHMVQTYTRITRWDTSSEVTENLARLWKLGMAQGARLPPKGRAPHRAPKQPL
jgi:hypothetical protein